MVAAAPRPRRPVDAAPLAPGLELHPLGPGYDAARWDERLRAARNASFADHWGSAPEDAEAFTHWRTATRTFRPECSAAACTSDGQVVGFLLAYEQDAETERTGSRDLYVGTVGTLAAWRGRGIAGALLAHALLRAGEQGYASSTLTVDTQNPTGALGVYDGPATPCATVRSPTPRCAWMREAAVCPSADHGQMVAAGAWRTTIRP